MTRSTEVRSSWLQCPRTFLAAVQAYPTLVFQYLNNSGRTFVLRNPDKVESCRRLDVPVKDYLGGVLPGLDRRAMSEVAELQSSTS
jgi:hypothetical protein